VADLAQEEAKRLRAELAQGLGYFPASLAAEDVARYREQIAKRTARQDPGERDDWAPGGYRWRQWDHLREERRRTEIETQGRASEAGGKPGQLLGDLLGALSGERADLPAVPGAHRVSGAVRRPSDARM
jgi:hypothetical protein